MSNPLLIQDSCYANQVKSNVSIRIDILSPKGYVWSKFKKCWTGDPETFRYFPESLNKSMDKMPPALIFSLVHYDSSSGWTESRVKVVKSLAVRLAKLLIEDRMSLEVDCEGHIIQQSWVDEGENQKSSIISTNIVSIKEPSFKVYTVQKNPRSVILDNIMSETEFDLIQETAEYSCGAPASPGHTGQDLRPGDQSKPTVDALADLDEIPF